MIFLIFVFIFRFLYLNCSSLSNYHLRFDFINLFYASMLYIIFSINNTFIWYLITKLNNCNINLLETIRIRLSSEFGKYIPGKIFSYGILLYNYENKNIPKKNIAFCSLQALLIPNLAVLIIALLSLYITDIPEINKYKFFLIFALAFCFMILHPKILLNASNIFLRIIKKETIDTPFSFRNTINVLIINIINWFIFGLAFYFFINSITDLSFSNFLYSTGAFAISGLMGMIAFFTPAGIGIREGFLILTLSYILPTAVASIIAITCRIWITILDVILFFIVFILAKHKISHGE